MTKLQVEKAVRSVYGKSGKSIIGILNSQIGYISKDRLDVYLSGFEIKGIPTDNLEDFFEQGVDRFWTGEYAPLMDMELTALRFLSLSTVQYMLMGTIDGSVRDIMMESWDDCYSDM